MRVKIDLLIILRVTLIVVGLIKDWYSWPVVILIVFANTHLWLKIGE